MTAFARHHRMRACQGEVAETVIEVRIVPIRRIMTGGAIRSILTVVCVIVTVTGIAVLRRRGKVHKIARVNMALHAGKTSVPAGKLEGEHAVIESFIEAIHSVMAIETGGTERKRMRGHERLIHLTVAGVASLQIERGDVATMAVIAGERFTRSRLLVSI